MVEFIKTGVTGFICLHLCKYTPFPCAAFFRTPSAPVTHSTMESTVEERTKLAYKNRWRTLYKNPKLVVIALFASSVSPDKSILSFKRLTLQQIRWFRVWLPAGRPRSVFGHDSIQGQFPFCCRVIQCHWLAHFDFAARWHPRLAVRRCAW